MDLRQFLRIAVGASLKLAELHRGGGLHGRISPSSILLEPESEHIALAPKAADATETWMDVSPEVLAYISPEQTGRVVVPLDQRADLYSLGVTFYRMLTGTLPFQARDAMEWFHGHVARDARPIREAAPSVPPQLAAIVHKLLSKSPNERYQSALGLHADLERCQRELSSEGRIREFALGERDAAHAIRMPSRLYGRDAERAQLLAALSRVVASRTPELTLIAGGSGVGKSALARELRGAAAREQAIFIEGKFDQYKRDVPYSTLVEAFQALLRQLLAEPEARLDAWRSAIKGALGGMGRVISDVIPYLELILGEQPHVPALPLSEAQNRFNLVFRQFLGVFATSAHPLVLFLDDVQWADPASLKLLRQVLLHRDTEHVLVVCAYRDREVDAAHPFSSMLDELRGAGGSVGTISLDPLTVEQLAELLADALDADADRVGPLARIVLEKTAGNPFFTSQLLGLLGREGLLRYDPGTAAWQWSIDEIRRHGFTDNVVELMAARLKQLDEEAQETLTVAACIGSRFTAELLKVVSARSSEDVDRTLDLLVREGLLLPEADAYRFLHDRVQQAAYALTPEAARASIHLRVGRLMRASATPAQLTERLFEVMNHLNHGVHLIDGAEERLALAELNLRAGQKAKEAIAHAAAYSYFARGLELLPEGAWESHHALKLALSKGAAECGFLASDAALAEQAFEEIIAHSRSPLEAAEVQQTRVILYTSAGRYADAVRVGVAALRTLSPAFPEAHDGWQAAAGEEMPRLRTRLAAMDVDGLIDAKVMEDPLQRAIAGLLAHTTSSAFNVDHALLMLLNVRLVDVSLEHGNAETSTCGYAWCGTILAMYFDDYDLASRLGRLAVRLAEKMNSVQFKSKVYDLVGWFVDFYCNPIASSLAYCREGYSAGIESGDLLYAGFNLMGCDLWLTATASRLDALEGELRQNMKQHAHIQHEMAVVHGTMLAQSVQSLRGLTHGWGSLDTASFDEAAFVERSIRGKIDYAAGAYHVVKLQLLFLYEDYAAALATAQAYDAIKDSSLGSFFGAEYRFFHSLTLAALHGAPGAENTPDAEAARSAHYKKLERWADTCPRTFAHKFLLVSAERARTAGEPVDAVAKLYDRAIASARENGFLRDEALGNELAARFYRQRGLATLHTACMRQARSCYARWGAAGKVRQIDERYPELLETAQAGQSAPQYLQPEHFDAMAAVQASQAISSEIVLDTLVQTLMRIVLEHAGAQRGALLLVQSDEPLVAATAAIARRGTEVHVARPMSPARAPDVVPAIVHYVKRTREAVLLENAAEHGNFALDEEVRRARMKSVVCLPIVRKADLVGILYLENNLVSGAFTPGRIALLEFLAAQAAISLENAALYASLRSENAERRQAEQTSRQSEERLRQLVETANVIPWEVDRATRRFTYVGPQAEKLIGYPVERWLDGSLFPDAVHADDRDRVLSLLHDALSGGRPRELEFRVKAAEGRVVWLHCVMSTLGADVRAKTLSGFFFDATDRKRAEAELRDKLAIIQSQQAAIRTLSTPIIEVWEGVITMPLFGAIDAQRAAQMTETMLAAVARTSARYAIIDVTGVAVLDTSTADHIVRLVRAVQLLGAVGIVVGIRPEVAQTLVSLGVDLSMLRTLSNLREALLLCMRTGGGSGKTRAFA